MTVLILGQNGSGKSAYAERLAYGFSAKNLYYIATMLPYGEEGQARVEKHRKQRAFADFITVERHIDVSGISFPPNSAILLEDVSNLLSNALFEYGHDVESVYDDITELCAKCRDIVIVSIGGLSALPEYDEETCRYINSLNRLNARLSGFADTVIEMRGGSPLILKGSL